MGRGLGGLGKTGSRSGAATTVLRASMPLLNQEVEVAIMKVRFEGVIPTVGGLGRRQDSRGRTAKPSGALSQAQSHLTLPGSPKTFNQSSQAGEWRQAAEADGSRVCVKGWDWATVKEILRRRVPCASGLLGVGAPRRGQQGSEQTAPGLSCSSCLLQLCPGTSWSNSNNFYSKLLSLRLAHATRAPSQAPRSTWRSPAGSS